MGFGNILMHAFWIPPDSLIRIIIKSCENLNEARVFDPFKMYNTKYLCYTPDLCVPSKTMIL